jgi:hypothetical protein
VLVLAASFSCRGGAGTGKRERIAIDHASFRDLIYEIRVFVFTYFYMLVPDADENNKIIRLVLYMYVCILQCLTAYFCIVSTLSIQCSVRLLVI